MEAELRLAGTESAKALGYCLRFHAASEKLVKRFASRAYPSYLLPFFHDIGGCLETHVQLVAGGLYYLLGSGLPYLACAYQFARRCRGYAHEILVTGLPHLLRALWAYARQILY